MAIVAFVYSDYDKYCPSDCFKGQYKDTEDALSTILGDRYDRHNLQLFDLSTLGWETYEWLPLYVYREKYIDNVDHHYLKHRWDEKFPEFEITWDGEVRKYGHGQVFYDAGEWMHVVFERL